MTRTVTIPHLGRIEGHGGIRVSVDGARVADVNLDIHEGSRYYEDLLLGKHYLDVQGIITRVCAICSADHTVTALIALEEALGVAESARTALLRELLLHGAAIESHALHVFALALPDFLGCGSLMTMAGLYPKQVAFALELKQLGNSIQETVGGRAVHPINTLVGGFGKVPEHRRIADLRRRLGEMIEPLRDVVEMVVGIEVPEWAKQPTLHVALRPTDSAFGWRGGEICTSAGDEHPVASYRETVREFTVEHSNARHAALVSGETYMVGSLARLALWGSRLEGLAAKANRRLLPEGAADNVLMNTRAQLVETIFAVEAAIACCETLLGLDEAGVELQEVRVRPGRGIGAVEAPRGTLFHEYELDEQGRVVAANVVTPTAQNLANIERDLRGSGDRLLAGDPDADLDRAFAMLTRAYDPCISCSVHVARLER